VEGITIRKATLEDAAEIANVHINSWREAYRGLLPQEFLDERPLNFKNRYELWKRVTQNSEQVTLVAESTDHGIVGFVNGTHGRDKEKKDWCEVWCIYLLKKYHGKKIGFNLLKQYFNAHIEKGFSKGYLWVLDDNPTIKFYERAGGKYDGKDKEDKIAGQKVKELMYEWENISL
jgi:GNAT superfamily N-acetyltransferase